MKKAQVFFVAALSIIFSSCSYKAFGNYPDEATKASYAVSPNFDADNGTFRNIYQQGTVVMRGFSPFRMLANLNSKIEGDRPSKPIHVVKTDLKMLGEGTLSVVWLGHSTLFVSYNGYNILVDPVFSKYASPSPLFNKAFEYTYDYTVEDFPDIDLLLITHDHYDHLDYETALKLKDMTAAVVTPLGVTSHLEYWGYEKDKLHEADWYEDIDVADGVKVTVVPAHHSSNRTTERRRTQWGSFILDIGGYKIFFGGDSGYSKHFADIGERYGGFDIAFLENGQYNIEWKQNHMFPEDTVRAAQDLKASLIMPIHYGKFKAKVHAWNEPIEQLLDNASSLGVNVTAPMIGEVYNIGDKPSVTYWWRGY